MKLAVIDTSIALPAIIGIADPAQACDTVRARLFFEWLDKDGWTCALAAPSLAEMLLKTDYASRAIALQNITTRARILPFDARASLLLVELWQLRGIDGTLQKQADSNGARRLLRFDAQIIAITKAAGAVLFSMDQRQRALASDWVRALPIPPDIVGQESIAFDAPAPADS